MGAFQIAKMTLEMVGGFRVSQCLGGPAAVEKVRDLNPDLLLLDAMMPEMDGPALLKLLRDSGFCSDTLVIFMTGRVESEEVASFMKLGVKGVIPKPFDPMTLSAQVEKLWNRPPDP